MAQIIRDQSFAGDQPFVEFRVYISTKDKKTICGYYQFDEQTAPRAVSFHKSSYGVPVVKAFAETKSFSESKDIPFILIIDPKNLFNEAAG